jgi:hypothetical protein
VTHTGTQPGGEPGIDMIPQRLGRGLPQCACSARGDAGLAPPKGLVQAAEPIIHGDPVSYQVRRTFCLTAAVRAQTPRPT